MREFGIYILENVVGAAVACGKCGRYWTTRTCAGAVVAVAAVVMSPADRKLLMVQVASVQQNKGGVAGLQSECVVKIYRPGWKTCCIHAALCYCELC